MAAADCALCLGVVNATGAPGAINASAGVVQINRLHTTPVMLLIFLPTRAAARAELLLSKITLPLVETTPVRYTGIATRLDHPARHQTARHGNDLYR